MRSGNGRRRQSLHEAVLSADYRRGLRDAAIWLLGVVRCLGANITRKSSSRVVDAWLERAVEHCYQTGERLYRVRLGVLGLQRLLHLSGPLLRGTWAALRGWQSLMPVRSRVPMSKYILQAVLLVCLARGFYNQGRERLRWWSSMLGCWLAFEALLRPGEVCALRVMDFTFPDPGLPSDAKVGLVIAIRKPKTRRVWRTQFVLVKDEPLISWLRWWLHGRDSKHQLLRVGRRDWAKLVSEVLTALDLQNRGFTLGSLRGGGATHFFRVTENLARLQYHGRWSRQETVKSYLQEALSTQVLSSATALAQKQLALAQEHVHFLSAPPPSSLRSLVHL